MVVQKDLTGRAQKGHQGVPQLLLAPYAFQSPRQQTDYQEHLLLLLAVTRQAQLLILRASQAGHLMRQHVWYLRQGSDWHGRQAWLRRPRILPLQCRVCRIHTWLPLLAPLAPQPARGLQRTAVPYAAQCRTGNGWQHCGSP